MTTDHGARDHAQWSASSTARNWTCAGALAMATLSGPDKESIYAAKGTACHQIAEKCLRSGGDAIQFLGTIEKTKEFDIEVTEEEVNTAQMYIDYVRSLKGDLLIEKRYSLDALSPPFEAGGTCDACSIQLWRRLLEIVDLKGGLGLVEVNENKQARSYGLMALLNMPPEVFEQIDTIKVTIVQPRAPHKDGRIRSEEFHVADLVAWTGELMAAMRRSKAAFDEFDALNGNRVLFDEWADKWLTVGSCTFCPAESICPKRKRDALKVVDEAVQKWFEDPTSSKMPEPTKRNAPELESPAELGAILDGFSALEDWIKAKRAYAHAQAELGMVIPGWQLSDAIGNRAWVAEEDKIVVDLKVKLGLTDDQLYKKKLVSPAQVEKIGGVKAKTAIANMWTSPIKGTNLVSTAKTTRPPVKSKVEQHFEEPMA